MASYTPQYYTTGTVPIPPSSKSQAYAQAYGYGGGGSGSGSTYSVSPPESTGHDHDHDASVTSGVPSYGSHSGYGHTTTTSSSSSNGGYGEGCYSDAGSASGVDFNDYMQDRFADSFDPIPLDRSLAVQAQTSGNLNAKHRELLEMQAKAQARLAKSRARFADGLQDAQEVRSNLEWTSKKVSSMKKKAEKKHSREYQKARERYPSPEY